MYYYLQKFYFRFRLEKKQWSVQNRDVPNSKRPELVNRKKVDGVYLDHPRAIGTTSADSAKFRGIIPRMYIEDLLC